ncbi:MAG: MSMEG_0568 family radical SAM protein [Deltaproteobacteria bacterium]|nr:MSMEG_0568 family radical SAM protein [Deltaproteobacteria bacterium]
MIPNLKFVITELQSLGLRAARDILRRQGGAGPAEGGALLLEGRAYNVPLASPFVAHSPYDLAEEEGRLQLRKHGRVLGEVALQAPPGFYRRQTSGGVPYWQMALLHGRDCLATSLLQTCVFWDTPARCRFCGIELSLAAGQTPARKDPVELAQVAAAAAAEDGVTHVVLTTGTGAPPGAELDHLAAAAQAIKEASGLLVHAQFMPPPRPGALARLQAAGVDTVGIHIEAWDPEVLRQVAPPKAALGREAYLQAWQAAVEVFGPGQVESFLVAGLGEEPASLVEGAAEMARLGVYPFVVPLRPIPGSLLGDALPPDPSVMHQVYGQVAAILRETGLASRDCLAGCVRCGACSALPAYEEEADGLVCHPARTRAELTAAWEVRHQVFVQEQGILPDTDQDEHDPRAIHLVARNGEGVVGTVRVFASPPDSDRWVGGRLAVKRSHRAGGAGELLVREAVRTVKRQGCRVFTASIQAPNVGFFQKLGWQCLGTPFMLHGKEHQLMQADLENAP